MYNTVCGNHSITGKRRCISLLNDLLEIDHIVKINPSGWFSNKNYNYKKKNVHVKRFIVLWDSCSLTKAVTTTWPDFVQQLIENKGNDAIELSNFSEMTLDFKTSIRLFSEK